MTLSIDVLALCCLLLIVISYGLWIMKQSLAHRLAKHKESLSQVYCRFCRQESKLNEEQLAQASKKAAACPICKREQWRGSSKHLL